VSDQAIQFLSHDPSDRAGQEVLSKLQRAASIAEQTTQHAVAQAGPTSDVKTHVPGNVVNLIKVAIPISATALFVIVSILWSGGARMPPDLVFNFAGLAGLTWAAYLIPRVWWS
jgi:hypothetical protein